jgi:hypothetical protein
LRLPTAILAFAIFTTSFANRAISATEDDSGLVDEMVGKYLDASKVQQESLRGVQMDVEISAKLPKQEKQGKLRALRLISRVGKISYRFLGFSGDTDVQHEVISRYLTAETEARDSVSVAISKDNYKFQLKRKLMQGEQKIYVFQLTPKKKKVGLFKGELWLDAETGMPVRESGELVKSPSVFLKKVEFVREYEMQDGVAVPTHIESTVDTHLVGRAELSINFSNYTRQVLDNVNPDGLNGDTAAR